MKEKERESNRLNKTERDHSIRQGNTERKRSLQKYQKKWNVFLFNKKKRKQKIQTNCVNQLCLFLPFYMQTKVNKSTLLPNYTCILKKKQNASNSKSHTRNAYQ